MRILFVLFYLVLLNTCSFSYPEQGRWSFNLTNNKPELVVSKTLFKDSKIILQIICSSTPPDGNISISSRLSQSICLDDVNLLSVDQLSDQLNAQGQNGAIRSKDNSTVTKVLKMEVVKCSGHILLDDVHLPEEKGPPAPPDTKPATSTKKMQEPTPSLMYVIPKDGFYSLSLGLTSNVPFTALVQVEMKAEYGYLSAAEWPLLPFYGSMCLVYVVFGVAWLIVSFLQWRDLLRIQFWIGGVILLGMLEKATFYLEYQSINNTGISVRGAVLLAEWVSCGKRTLARMLVVIVSLGYGIVKPRLGPLLHRVVGVGACYLVLAAVESYLRVSRRSDGDNQLLIASIPLAVLDSAICWWIFTSLVHTTRTLRIRGNVVKLTLYRHFTNSLIFAVVASVIFMLYSIKAHRLTVCLTDWKELWVDEAYWHILFSVLLLVIMILWRPTNNNQRYAFTPLLDAAEDEEEDEENLFTEEAYGVKMRNHSRPTSPKAPLSTDEIIKWMDDHVPTTGLEPYTPMLDSEEELETTKLEQAKMQ